MNESDTHAVVWDRAANSLTALPLFQVLSEARQAYQDNSPANKTILAIGSFGAMANAVELCRATLERREVVAA